MSGPPVTDPLTCCPGAAEVWKPVPGWPHFASDHGRIANARGMVLKSRPSNRPEGAEHRYQLIDLKADGRRKTVTVHSLVLFAHVGERPDGQESRHGNDVPDDNHLSNLCWGTPDQNAADKARQPRYSTAVAAERRKAGAHATNAKRRERLAKDFADLAGKQVYAIDPKSPAWRLALGNRPSRFQRVRSWFRRHPRSR